MVNRLFFLSNIAFLLLFLLLSWHNRLAADDFALLHSVQEEGVWNSMLGMYKSWSPRWPSILLNYLVLKFYFPGILFLFNLTALALLAFSIYRLIRSIQEFHYPLVQPTNYFPPETGAHQAVNYTLIFINCFFYATFSIGETWFWLTAACAYLWSIIFLCLGISAILANRKSLIHYLIAAVSFTYVGGASELLTLVLLEGLIVIAVSKSLPIRGESGGRFIAYTPSPATPFGRRRPARSIVLISILFLLASFLIFSFGPGNSRRAGFFPDVTLWEALFINGKSYVKILLFKLLPKLPLLLLFSLPWLFAGRACRKTLPVSLKVLTGCYFLLIFIHHFPAAYVMADIAPDRALAPVSFYTAVFLAYLFYYAGAALHPPGGHAFTWFMTKGNAAPAIVLACCLAVNTGVLIWQLPVVSTYSAAYDARLHHLRRMKLPHHATHTLDPLPPPGLLYSAEITADTAHPLNQHLKKGLGLDFAVRVAK